MGKAFTKALFALLVWSFACVAVEGIVHIVGTANPKSQWYESTPEERAWIDATIAVVFPAGAILLVVAELSRPLRERVRRRSLTESDDTD